MPPPQASGGRGVGGGSGGVSGGAAEEEETWSCSACTFNNHVALEMCEMCDMPRAGGVSGASGGASGGARLRGAPCTPNAVHYISPYNGGGRLLLFTDQD
jgi:hypothetical protein